MSISLFDIIGPRMIGPSSSHTAGAVRIGQVANRLVNGKVRAARVTLFGSFAETGRGHGTDTAIDAIADFCGFGSGRALRTLFLRVMGVSMKEFREKSREKKRG